MNEAARQAALKSMGVPVLLSRFQLPGAKPSAVLAAIESSGEQVDSLIVSATNTEAKSSAKPAASVAYTNADNHTGDSLAKQTMQSVSELFNTGKTKRQSRAQAVLAAEEAKVADAAESATDEQLGPQSTVLPYQHYCIQLDTLLVIIDPSYYQTSTGGGESSVLAFDDAGQKNIVRFLRDIYSLTFKKNSNRLCLNTFSWPPHQALPGHIQQAQMAYSMQQSFLETLSQTQHFDYALVFSEGYVGALFGEEEKQTLAHGYLSKLQGVNTLKVGSLQSYWKNSQLKNDLWSSLQALTHASEI